MFLVKQPSIVCRVLNSDLCPPHDLLHDIDHVIFFKIMFLVKQPSVVCCVLNSDLCPPHDLLHDIESYPIFMMHFTILSTISVSSQLMKTSVLGCNYALVPIVNCVQRVHLSFRLCLLSMMVWRCVYEWMILP